MISKNLLPFCNKKIIECMNYFIDYLIVHNQQLEHKTLLTNDVRFIFQQILHKSLLQMPPLTPRLTMKLASLLANLPRGVAEY